MRFKNHSTMMLSTVGSTKVSERVYPVSSTASMAYDDISQEVFSKVDSLLGPNFTALDDYQDLQVHTLQPRYNDSERRSSMPHMPIAGSKTPSEDL